MVAKVDDARLRLGKILLGDPQPLRQGIRFSLGDQWQRRQLLLRSTPWRQCPKPCLERAPPLLMALLRGPKRSLQVPLSPNAMEHRVQTRLVRGGRQGCEPSAEARARFCLGAHLLGGGLNLGLQPSVLLEQGAKFAKLRAPWQARLDVPRRGFFPADLAHEMGQLFGRGRSAGPDAGRVAGGLVDGALLGA